MVIIDDVKGTDKTEIMCFTWPGSSNGIISNNTAVAAEGAVIK